MKRYRNIFYLENIQFTKKESCKFSYKCLINEIQKGSIKVLRDFSTFSDHLRAIDHHTLYDTHFLRKYVSSANQYESLYKNNHNLE